ncbi:MAG: hypothetical protein GY795_38140 [Desulfobacterales bacterium]|nr:hypothetical protein [Desulfobacterales bacterium]
MKQIGKIRLGISPFKAPSVKKINMAAEAAKIGKYTRKGIMDLSNKAYLIFLFINSKLNILSGLSKESF